jgi:hypothetical protein
MSGDGENRKVRVGGALPGAALPLLLALAAPYLGPPPHRGANSEASIASSLLFFDPPTLARGARLRDGAARALAGDVTALAAALRTATLVDCAAPAPEALANALAAAARLHSSAEGGKGRDSAAAAAAHALAVVALAGNLFVVHRAHLARKVAALTAAARLARAEAGEARRWGWGIAAAAAAEAAGRRAAGARPILPLGIGVRRRITASGADGARLLSIDW